jgi:hypothetical protein
MLQSFGIQPELSNILLERASRYTPDPVEQARLADRTIAVALDNVDFIDDPYPELGLYSAMHRIVREDQLSGAKPAADRDRPNEIARKVRGSISAPD